MGQRLTLIPRILQGVAHQPRGVLFTGRRRTVGPRPSGPLPLQETLAVQRVHHRHHGGVGNRSAPGQAVEDLTHRRRLVPTPHHVHDRSFQITEPAHPSTPRYRVPPSLASRSWPDRSTSAKPPTPSTPGSTVGISETGRYTARPSRRRTIRASDTGRARPPIQLHHEDVAAGVRSVHHPAAA